jgi:hypothetical protein
MSQVNKQQSDRKLAEEVTLEELLAELEAIFGKKVNALRD